MMGLCDEQPHASTLFVAGRVLMLCLDRACHDSWISRGLYRNAAGEFCCGQVDCFMVPPDQVSMIGTGYRLFGAEFVPFSETQPSPDGAFWRCKRPDGSRRCFFAPTPLM